MSPTPYLGLSLETVFTSQATSGARLYVRMDEWEAGRDSPANLVLTRESGT